MQIRSQRSYAQLRTLDFTTQATSTMKCCSIVAMGPFHMAEGSWQATYNTVSWISPEYSVMAFTYLAAFYDKHIFKQRLVFLCQLHSFYFLWSKMRE